MEALQPTSDIHDLQCYLLGKGRESSGEQLGQSVTWRPKYDRASWGRDGFIFLRREGFLSSRKVA